MVDDGPPSGDNIVQHNGIVPESSDSNRIHGDEYDFGARPVNIGHSPLPDSFRFEQPQGRLTRHSDQERSLWNNIERSIIPLRSAISSFSYARLDNEHDPRDDYHHHHHSISISRKTSLGLLVPASNIAPRNQVDLSTVVSLCIAVIAILVSTANVPPAVVFVMNLVAIVPLSVVLTTATENLAQELGPVIGALLNISFGNLVELIVFITALQEGHIKVVQSSLIGSILVNLLLVLGSAMITGGLKYQEQTYNNDLTQVFIGLLYLTIFSLMIPTAFYGTLHDRKSADHVAIMFSRLDSLILLGMYFLYLLFQFKSHASMFGLGQSNNRSDEASTLEQGQARPVLHVPTRRPEMADLSPAPFVAETDRRTECVESSYRHPSHRDSVSSSTSRFNDPGKPGEALEIDQPHSSTTKVKLRPCFTRSISISLLVISTILIAICADFLISAFTDLNEQGVLGKSVVGLIIIPIAGNVAEITAAVIVAGKDEMDLAINIAVGSAIQIGLLLSPVMVLIGWATNKEMSLHFDLFETVSLVATVFLVSFLILKGRTNYFEGAMLNACFAAIAVGAFLLPDSL